MNLNIRTTVAIKDNQVVVTALHPVTGWLWEILHNTKSIFDSGAYTMDRPDGPGQQTQFVFTPSEGFTLDCVRSIVAVGAYIATVYKGDLDSFWQIGVREHTRRVRSTIDIKFPGIIDGVLEELVFNEWIKRQAVLKIEQAYKNNVVCHGPSNLDFTQNRIDSAKVAINRLEFAKPEDHGIIAFEKDQRLKKANLFMQKLEADHQLLRTLAAQTNSIHEKIKSIRDHLIERIEATSEVGDFLLHDYHQYLHHIEQADCQLTRLSDQFNEEVGARVLKEIILLCPPAK